MKVSTNFDIREFVPKSTFQKYGVNARWFVSMKAVAVAEFYKEFFSNYYKTKQPGKVSHVSIVVNNWHIGGSKQHSGYRPPEYTEGAKESQHRMANAFDCEIVVVYLDGKREEVNYKEIHEIIKANEALFLSKGVTTVEDVAIAATWLHTDFRWTGLSTILIVRP
jgi:hypothetical protein